MSQQNSGSVMKFLVPSLLGIALFMVPVPWGDGLTIIVKIIADGIVAAVGEYLPHLCVFVVTVSAVLGLLTLKSPSYLATYPIVRETFSATFVWVFIRVLGAVFIWLVFLGIDAGEDSQGIIHMITEENAGNFVLHELLAGLSIIFFLAGVLLPLLLDFGLLEFVGALLTRVMRPFFRVPGRAAVDCITSWIGDGTLGVMLTANQYEGGYYSKREACIISTTFSSVSITFSLVVLTQVDLMEYFGAYYGLICLVGLVCALILPRIPPLSLKDDSYLVPGHAMGDGIPEGYASAWDYGLDLAKKRVATHRGLGEFLENGLKNAAGMLFGVLPVVMCIGTLALVISNNTRVFDILGEPFMPLLEFLNIPEAEAASETMCVGFLDMFTPSILASDNIVSPLTRFIVAVVSVTQLIYLSEVGGMILGSKIPVSLPELFILFLERTVISLLVTAPIAHIIFG